MAELKDLVSELMSLNNENLSKRIINDNDVQWCLSELYDMLAVDLVEVVRCKDCSQYAPSQREGCIGGRCRRTYHGVYLDDFCSYGEREGKQSETD